MCNNMEDFHEATPILFKFSTKNITQADFLDRFKQDSWEIGWKKNILIMMTSIFQYLGG